MAAALPAPSSAPAERAESGATAVLARSSCPHTYRSPAASARERELLRRAERAAHLAGVSFYPYTRKLGIERAQRNTNHDFSSPAVAFAWSADWLRPLPLPSAANGGKDELCGAADIICLPEACPAESRRQPAQLLQPQRPTPRLQQRDEVGQRPQHPCTHRDKIQLATPAATTALAERRPYGPQAMSAARMEGDDEYAFEEGVPPLSAALITAAARRRLASDPAAYADAQGCHQEAFDIAAATAPRKPGEIPAGL
jgi:hypothetical protein